MFATIICWLVLYFIINPKLATKEEEEDEDEEEEEHEMKMKKMEDGEIGVLAILHMSFVVVHFAYFN